MNTQLEVGDVIKKSPEARGAGIVKRIVGDTIYVDMFEYRTRESYEMIWGGNYVKVANILGKEEKS